MRGAENFVLVLPQGVLYPYYTNGEECIVSRGDVRGQGDSVSDRAGISPGLARSRQAASDGAIKGVRFGPCFLASLGSELGIRVKTAKEKGDRCISEGKELHLAFDRVVF